MRLHLEAGQREIARTLFEEATRVPFGLRQGLDLAPVLLGRERGLERPRRERAEWEPWVKEGAAQARMVVAEIDDEMALMEGRLDQASLHFDAAGQVIPDAARGYERLLTIRSLDLSLYPWVRYESLFKLGDLYERLGRRDQAMARTRAFLDHWGKADAPRSRVGEARARLKRLTSGS